ILLCHHREWPLLTGTSSRTSVPGVMVFITCWELIRRPSPEQLKSFSGLFILKTGIPYKHPLTGLSKQLESTRQNIARSGRMAAFTTLALEEKFIVTVRAGLFC